MRSTNFGYKKSNSARKKPDMLAVIDDGHGMDPMMIRAAVVWGGTHRHNDRAGFGRYGYGLPSASVSIGTRYTVFSKTEDGLWHKVTVDLDEIEEHFHHASGPVHAEEPKLLDPPDWVLNYVKMNFKDFNAGTVVLLENIDRIDHTTQKLKAELLQDFGITYRNFLNEVSIVVDGTPAEPTDPLFLTPGYRFYDLDCDRAIGLTPLEIDVKDSESGESKGLIKVRFSYMPPTFLRTPEYKLRPKARGKGANNARFRIRKENNGFIFLRAGRQIDVVNSKSPVTFQNNDRYLGVEVDFPPTLDEQFSITTSKQQIVPKSRIWDILEENGVFDAISEMGSRYDKEAEELRHRAEDTQEKRPSEAAIETAQRFFTQAPTEPTAEQRRKSEENLEREADKLAEQINIPKEKAKDLLEASAQASPFKIKLEDMPGAPFYWMKQVGGQKILYINKAHRFYGDLYASSHATPHVRYALEAVLLVMGDCEIRAKAERQMFYEQERQLWSVNLNTTLRALEEWNTSEDPPQQDGSDLQGASEGVGAATA